MPTPLQPDKRPDAPTGYSASIGGIELTDSMSIAYQVIASMSQIDAWQQDLFVDLLGGTSSIATAAYLALKTRGPKTAAISEVAKVALPEEAFPIFSRIVEAADCLESYRNKIAHWKSYDVDYVKDGICLQDPRAKDDFYTAPANGIFIFTNKEMKSYIRYAVQLAKIQFDFQDSLKSEKPWTPEICALLNQKLETLATERQRL